MPIIQRSALVERPASCLFDLVHNVAAYPSLFDWCKKSHILEQNERRIVARLDLGLGALSTWFTTENTFERPRYIDLELRDGPFNSLRGKWEFLALSDDASKVSLHLEFEPSSRLLAPMMALGFQHLADRMVNDFVKTAQQTYSHK